MRRAVRGVSFAMLEERALVLRGGGDGRGADHAVPAAAGRCTVVTAGEGAGVAEGVVTTAGAGSAEGVAARAAAAAGTST